MCLQRTREIILLLGLGLAAGVFSFACNDKKKKAPEISSPGCEADTCPTVNDTCSSGYIISTIPAGSDFAECPDGREWEETFCRKKSSSKCEAKRSDDGSVGSGLPSDNDFSIPPPKNIESCSGEIACSYTPNSDASSCSGDYEVKKVSGDESYACEGIDMMFAVDFCVKKSQKTKCKLEEVGSSAGEGTRDPSTANLYKMAHPINHANQSEDDGQYMKAYDGLTLDQCKQNCKKTDLCNYMTFLKSDSMGVKSGKCYLFKGAKISDGYLIDEATDAGWLAYTSKKDGHTAREYPIKATPLLSAALRGQQIGETKTGVNRFQCHELCMSKSGCKYQTHCSKDSSVFCWGQDQCALYEGGPSLDADNAPTRGRTIAPILGWTGYVHTDRVK